MGSEINDNFETRLRRAKTLPKDVGAGDADYVSKPTMPRFDAFDPYSETVN